MDALSSLAVYSDSDEEDDGDSDQLMTDKQESTALAASPSSPSSILSCSENDNKHIHTNGNNTSHNVHSNAAAVDDTYKPDCSAPPIPRSPDLPVSQHIEQTVIALLQKHGSHQNYVQHTFQRAEFQDNPEIVTMLLHKLQMFQYNDKKEMEASTHAQIIQPLNGDSNATELETDYKLEEYASALPVCVHNPLAFREKEDNVDTLMRCLEDKIRENERRLQEKRERKEKQKQLMLKERAEHRVATPNKPPNVSQRYPHQQTLNALNAAKQAVLAQKTQFSSHRKERRSKRSRWDDQ